MKIHKDEFYDILQNIINDYDERIRITLKSIRPKSYFRNDLYANVMDIIKGIMKHKNYIYEKKYPNVTEVYIIGFHNDIIIELCNYIYDKCSDYKLSDTDIETMFNKSEIVKEKRRNDGRLILEVDDVDAFNFPRQH